MAGPSPQPAWRESESECTSACVLMRTCSADGWKGLESGGGLKLEAGRPSSELRSVHTHTYNVHNIHTHNVHTHIHTNTKITFLFFVFAGHYKENNSTPRGNKHHWNEQTTNLCTHPTAGEGMNKQCTD